MIGNKIKALLELTEKTTNDACNYLNILQPAFSRKINKNTFKTEELIKLASLTNTRLAFIDEDNQPIILFNEKDLKESND